MRTLKAALSLCFILFCQSAFAGIDKDIDVRRLQTMLSDLCYKTGPIDGIWGAKTERATTEFFNKFFSGYKGQVTQTQLFQLSQFYKRFKMGIYIDDLECGPHAGVQPKNNVEDALNVENVSRQIGTERKLLGSINFLELDAYFSKNQSLLKSQCYVNYDTRALSVVETMYAEVGYGGSDKRIQPLANRLLELTSNCYAGLIHHCELGITGLKEYAALDAPKEDKSAKFSKDKRTANDYIVNTSFISPVINFLSVYNKKVGLTDAEVAVFDKWLISITDRYRKPGHLSAKKTSMKEQGTITPWRAGNHYISSSISSSALGAWLGDKKLLNYGVQQWKHTLGTMRADGSLPIETSRGSRAILYSGYTITKLIRLAEILRNQGVDLYSTEVNGKSIHHNISFYLDVLENPKIIHKYARANFASGGSIPYTEQEEIWGMYSGHHAWITPYILRFPNHENTKRLKAFTGKENVHTQNLAAVVRQGFGGSYGLDLHPRCFYFRK